MKLRPETLNKIDEFLQMYPRQNTKNTYLTGLKRFEKWYGDSVTKLIGSEEAERTVEKFFIYLKENGVPQNSRRIFVNSVKVFLKFHGTEIRLRKGLGASKMQKARGQHRLRIEELQRMSSVASLYEQIVLEALLLGWSVSDIVSLEKKDFDVLDREAPIPIQIRRGKTEELYESFISQEFKDLLELYLPTVEGKWLFPGAKLGTHTKSKTLNKLLKELAERAKVKLHGRLSWHSGRKLVYSTGAALGIPKDVRKRLVGKAEPYSDDTYLDIDLKEPFLKIHNVLRLKKAKSNEKVGNLMEAMDLVLRTLRKLCIKELEAQGYSTGTIGLLRSYDRLSHKEVLEEYLKET